MIEFRNVKKVKAKKAYLISGLPGIGLVGKLCVDHLINELKAKKVAEIYSDDFPAQAIIEDSTSLRLLKNEIYYVKIKSNDIFFLAGDTQTISVAGSYELAKRVIEFLKKYNLKTIITLGGIAVGELKKEPSIFGAFTGEDIKNKFKRVGVIFNKKTNAVLGAAGVFVGIGSTFYNIDGVCLMGETHGNYVDANASKAMVNIFSKFFGKKIDTKSLEKRAKEIGEIIENLEKAQQQQKEQQLNPPIKREDTMNYIR